MDALEALWKKLHAKPESEQPDEDAQEAGPPGDEQEGQKAFYLIVGLGNPGRKYRGNRHNAGFMLVDHLASRLGVTFSKIESRALVARADYQDRRLLLVKPQTYMNESGQAVGALLRFYKAPRKNLMVICDDVDLPLGTLRLRPSGGSAGQKGIQSIIERLGSEAFPRLRLGIGRPPGRMEAAAYVLQDFSPVEIELFSQVLERGAGAVLTYLTASLDAAMNQYNGSLEEG